MKAKDYSYINLNLLLSTCLQLLLICFMIYGFGRFIDFEYYYNSASSTQGSVETLNSLQLNCSSRPQDIPFCKGKEDSRRPVSILLLGDSVDRHSINDGCIVLKGNHSDWINGTIVYVHGAGHMCSLKNGVSIAAFQTFGSKPHGPYPHGIKTTAVEVYPNTGTRIHKGLSVYKQRMGKYPDYISLGMAIWDMFYYSEMYEFDDNVTESTWVIDKEDFIAAFSDNLTKYLQLIREITGQQTKLFMHTKPRTGWSMHHDYMDAIREVGQRNNVPIIDWHRMTAHKSDVLRDKCHPHKCYSSFFSRLLVDFFSCYEA